MKILLIINGLFEGLFGLTAIAIPARVWEGADGLAQSIGRAMGFACLTVALLSFLAVRRLDNRGVVSIAVIALLVWHAGLAALQTLAAVQHFAPPPPAVIHALFAVVFVVFLVRTQREAATAGTAKNPS